MGARWGHAEMGPRWMRWPRLRGPWPLAPAKNLAAPVARDQSKLITSAMITAQADPIPIRTTAARIQRNSRSGSQSARLGREGWDGRNGTRVGAR